jgi:UDP-2,3-diacylglucosamine pyrophosphatase LpxH
MIIIADAHVAEARGNTAAFFQMLDRLEKSDQDLVFLGDVFELWIAFDRYEEEIHRRFLSWCKARKHRRSIGYVEGNHEYYLADRRRDSFTWVADGSLRQEARRTFFVHGELINRQDINCRVFRKISKNAAARNLARVLPFGPSFVHCLNRGFKNTNQKFRKYLPVDAIKAFADETFRHGVDTIFVGHFHCKYEYSPSPSKTLHCLPAWLQTGEVTVFDESSKRIRHQHWQDLKI